MAEAVQINLSNQFLIAMPGMSDDNFSGSVVYLCEHSDKGALGLVINKPIDIKLRNLFERVDLTLDREDLVEEPVFFGGPVQTERGFVLHDPIDDHTTHYSSTLAVPGGLEMTTSKDVLEALSAGSGPRRVLVTLGYAGWGAGQLEAEMAQNAWLSGPADLDIVFRLPAEKRWEIAANRIGVDLAALSHDVGHA